MPRAPTWPAISKPAAAPPGTAQREDETEASRTTRNFDSRYGHHALSRSVVFAGRVFKRTNEPMVRFPCAFSEVRKKRADRRNNVVSDFILSDISEWHFQSELCALEMKKIKCFHLGIARMTNGAIKLKRISVKCCPRLHVRYSYSSLPLLSSEHPESMKFVFLLKLNQCDHVRSFAGLQSNHRFLQKALVRLAFTGNQLGCGKSNPNPRLPTCPCQ